MATVKIKRNCEGASAELGGIDQTRWGELGFIRGKGRGGQLAGLPSSAEVRGSPIRL